MKIFDLFCGAGGFSKGFEQVVGGNFETVLGVDILPMSVETLRLNHPGALGVCGDIRQLRCADIGSRLKIKKGELGLIIGGPPCQGFLSIRPFRSSHDDDPRNSLFEQFANFVNYFRPRALVMENVVPREGARLQSFDDDYKFAGNRSQIVKQIGNAVPPLRGKAIGQALATALVS